MSNELSTTETGGGLVPLKGARGPYLAMTMPAEALADVVGANLVEGMGLRDLATVKVPSGDTDQFMFPTSGGVEARKEFTGVIVGKKGTRAHWKDPIGAGKTPPDCSCSDTRYGIGEGSPGGGCAACSLNKFGSAPERTPGVPSKGKACSEKMNLLILTESTVLPIVLVVPPTSLKGAGQHMRDLATFGKPFWSVETRFRLTNTGDYCVVQFEIAQSLTAEQEAFFEQRYREIKPVLDAMQNHEDTANAGGQQAPPESGVFDEDYDPTDEDI
jgi:hypothetical protein